MIGSGLKLTINKFRISKSTIKGKIGQNAKELKAGPEVDCFLNYPDSYLKFKVVIKIANFARFQVLQFYWFLLI